MTHDFENDHGHASMKMLWGILAIAATAMFACLPDDQRLGEGSSINSLLVANSATPDSAPADHSDTDQARLQRELLQIRQEVQRLQTEISELRQQGG